MFNVSTHDSSLVQQLFKETRIETYLISENALLLKFEIRENDTKLLHSNKLFNENLPIAISSLKSYFVENANTQKRLIIDSIPSYDSLLLQFNLRHIRGLDFKKLITNYLAMINKDFKNSLLPSSKVDEKPNSAKTITIPTYYGVDVGWDLLKLSSEKKLSIEEIISIHSKHTYTVCAIGFSPGFAYMGFVPPQIQHKRLSKPRTSVFPGSVGIAEDQTGIYPSASPGGWNIL